MCSQEKVSVGFRVEGVVMSSCVVAVNEVERELILSLLGIARHPRCTLVSLLSRFATHPRL